MGLIMNLGFDIDEIVADITGSMLEYMYTEFGIIRSISVFKKYGLDECRYVFDDELNTEIIKQLCKLVHSNTFLYDLRPVYGAVESINVLHSKGHKIHFITARPDINNETTHKWFAKYSIPYDSITTTNGMSKGEIINELKLDTFIDDHIKYLDSIAKVNKNNTKLFLLDKPWNLCYTNSRIKRVLNWPQILGEINEYTRTSKK